MADLERRTPDVEYFEWLVASRSRNQATSLRLYKVIKEHKSSIKEQANLIDIVQALVAASFSLWRAVFLSDVTPEHQAALEDAESFLENLIQNNAVAYPQDRNARYWSFRYYVSNARDRLNRIAERVEPKLNSPVTGSNQRAEEWWDTHQDVLDETVKNFELGLNDGVSFKVKKST